MPVIVAFVSQKGGVGKSTLARGLATLATRNGLTPKIADLDVQQRTVIVWELARGRHRVAPPVEVVAADGIEEALEYGKQADLLVLDTAGKITEAINDMAKAAHLIVQPTGPSVDDLHIAVLVFLALERVGVARERLAFALSGVLSGTEERDARAFLASFGYPVLEGAVPAHAAYREAMRVGRSIIETRRKTLDGRAERLLQDMMRRAIGNAGR